MIVHECKQGSPEWHQLRLGKPTASVFKEIVTPVNGDLSKSSIKLAHKLLAERFLGYPLDSFTSAAMDAGREGEPKARAWYEFRHDCEVREVGICFTDDGRIGASPDGITGHATGTRFMYAGGGCIAGRGLLEIKCPNHDTHIGYMLNEAGIGAEYRTQIQGQLWICEAEWLDSLSYCPPFPPRLVRIERDEDFITNMSLAVRQFADQLDQMEAKLRGLGCLQMVQEMEQETGDERDDTLGMTDAEAREFLQDLMEQAK